MTSHEQESDFHDFYSSVLTGTIRLNIKFTPGYIVQDAWNASYNAAISLFPDANIEKIGQRLTLGIVERNADEKTAKCNMEKVDNTEAETLVCLIYDHYFVHKTVNHSINFIDPDSGACTNRIESLWRECKQKFKEMNGCKRLQTGSLTGSDYENIDDLGDDNSNENLTEREDL
ncbi:unnamed protein product [Brachionus calyciflorus]|uniref:Uncharacterized protein n=1 Tax=Brachionus calyciflorus TaxID=104777 RepID=A0A813U3W2_9BILA|nr:unnamed protein product [Brachionus calyciflorus]